MRKQRLGLFLSNRPAAGGLFQYSLSVLDALALEKNQYFDLVAIYAKDVWESYLVQYDIEIHQFVDTRAKNVYKFLRSLNLNMLVCPSQLPHIYLSEIVPDIPLAVMICDLNFYYDREVFNLASGFTECTYMSSLKRLGNICNRARIIFVDSILGKEQIVRLYGEACEDKVRVLPFCVPKYIQKHIDNEVIDFNVNLPDKYIFYPANYLAYKNHHNLILAVKQLKSEGILVNLLFCGNQKRNFSKVMQLIFQENLEEQITVLSYVSNNELISLYKKARAMMMPTLVGPTNIPPLEAMYLGCPVAVSHIGAMPEQVGEGGMTFDPYNVSDIAECMKKLWLDDNECKRLVKNGLVQIEKFSSNKFKEILIQNIEDSMEELNKATHYLQNMRSVLCNKFVICYGAGEIGYWTQKCCQSLNISIKMFFDRYSDEKSMCDIPIVKPAPFSRISEKYDAKDVYVILAVGEDIQCEIKNYLESLGYRKFYLITYSKEIIDYFHLSQKYPYNI